MDYNKSNDPVGTNIFSTLSLSLGVASLVLLIILPPLTFPLGGMAILFAILSTGRSSTYPVHSKIGLVTGCVGLCLITLLFVGTFYFMMTSPEFIAELNLVYEQLYGVSYDEAIKSILD